MKIVLSITFRSNRVELIKLFIYLFIFFIIICFPSFSPLEESLNNISIDINNLQDKLIDFVQCLGSNDFDDQLNFYVDRNFFCPLGDQEGEGWRWRWGRDGLKGKHFYFKVEIKVKNDR